MQNRRFRGGFESRLSDRFPMDTSLDSHHLRAPGHDGKPEMLQHLVAQSIVGEGLGCVCRPGRKRHGTQMGHDPPFTNPATVLENETSTRMLVGDSTTMPYCQKQLQSHTSLATIP